MFIKIVSLKKYKLDLQLKQLNTQNQKNACQRQTQTRRKQEEKKPIPTEQKKEY